jgi:hypothetical protein
VKYFPSDSDEMRSDRRRRDERKRDEGRLFYSKHFMRGRKKNDAGVIPQMQWKVRL